MQPIPTADAPIEPSTRRTRPGSTARRGARTLAGVFRAHRLARIAAGACAHDPLFATDDGTPFGDRRLAQALLDAQVECGVNVTGGRIPRGDLDARAWAHRYGVSIQPINPEARR